MHRYFGLGMAAVLALGVAVTAFSADAGAKKEANIKTGVVKKVDVDAKKITVMVVRELVFTVTADTKIAQGEAVKTLADIKEGDTVTVEYARQDKDTRVAVKITIVPAAAPGAPAPAK